MKRIKKGNRLLAVALSVLLAFGGLPTAAFAEGQPVQITQGLCEHHQGHTVECGYAEGQPCEHEHSEDCYTDELICGYKVNGGEADREGGLGRDETAETTVSGSDAEHTHAQECYAQECPHERGKHDDTCGYEKAQACGYTCELCGKTDNEPEPKPGEETEQTACMLTEDCTLADGHEGECVTEPGEGEIADALPLGEKAATATVPGAPQNFTVTPSKDRVYLTWEAPDSNGGAEIISYQVSKDGGGSWVKSDLYSDCTLFGLTSGTLYTFQVRAVNSVGPGEAASVSVTWPTADNLPSAPQNVTATVGYDWASLSWEAPSSNGGAEIIKYQVGVKSLSWTDVSADTYSHSFTGLRNGREYSLYVRAVTSLGAGDYVRIRVTPEGSCSISGEVETMMNGDNRDIRDIEVTLWQDGKKFGEVKTDDRGEFSFNSLAPGEYTVKAGGWGKIGKTEAYYTEQSETVTTIDGDEYVNFTLEPGNAPGTYTVSGNVKVFISGSGSFDAPDVPVELWQNGERVGSTVTAESDATYSFFSVAPGSYTLRIPAGTYGGAYQVEYQKSFVVENSDVRLEPITLESGTAPDSHAVTGTVKGSGNSGLSGVPVRLMNDNVKRYETTTGADGSYSFSDVSEGTYTLKIPAGIYAGTTYQEANKSITVSGGALSAGDLMLNPAPVPPSAPQNFQATPGDMNVMLTWEPPASDGKVITKYQYSVSTSDVDNWLDIPGSGADTISHTVSGLTNGVEYTFKVRAFNSVGAGAEASVNESPVTVPGLPQNFQATPGDKEVTLTWKWPLNNNVARVTYYQYACEPSEGGLNNWKDAPYSDFKVTGLTNGTEYTFKLRAGNAAGFVSEAVSTTVTPKAPATVPTAPQKFQATPGDQQVVLSWAAPQSDGGAAITKYEVSKDGGGSWVNASNTTDRTFTGLTNGQSYTFRVRAVNSVGAGEAASVTETPQAPATVPTAPQNLQATPGDQQVALSWKAPQNNGGAAITKYEVSSNGGTAWEDASSATGHTFDGLTNGQSYTFQVRAVNSKGAGKAAEAKATPQAGATATFILTVQSGRDITASGPYAEGARVVIQADAATSGMTFDEWAGGANSIFDSGSRTSPTTTITMPAGYVTLTATYKRIGGGSPDNGGSTGGGGGSYTAPEIKNSYTRAGNNTSQAISRSDLRQLANDGKSLTVQNDKAKMTFDPAALKAILAAVPATAGNITFAAVPADISAFPEAAKLIGNRPVYSFTISYKDSKGNAIPVNVNFPAGSASISLYYAPAAGEVTGSLFMVYVDGKGAVTWLDKSSYAGGKVLADVPHFSVYGVAYKAPVPVFTDITNHWAKADMEFVAARGLLSGTDEKVFSPDAAMTRGMFVTALGRLAGVNPASYQTRSFADVPANAYYAAYVEWAAQKNIVKGTGEGVFSPDAPVIREQMAVMMTNYAGQMGYSISVPLAAVTFADNDKISAWAAKEVAAMQRAGIIKGKDGNRFDPQGNATRAEVSAVLSRFVEIVIDPATAAGWVRNDSGHWLYYQGGKALTGWQTIGKLRYYFNSDGVMHEGWKQDTDTNKWYYWTNAGAATGWREIGGKWYYFDENGVMAVNTKIDGYEVGPDGARKEN